MSAAVQTSGRGRESGWEARLFDVIEDARSRPYALGEHDCFRVACKAVHALTLEDHWPAFAGRYRNRREALRVMAAYGASFEAFVDAVFGAPRVGVRLARRGDLVALQTADGEKHLGVELGGQVACLGEHGLLYVPTLTCLCAWRIG